MDAKVDYLKRVVEGYVKSINDNLTVTLDGTDVRYLTDILAAVDERDALKAQEGTLKRRNERLEEITRQTTLRFMEVEAERDALKERSELLTASVVIRDSEIEQLKTAYADGMEAAGKRIDALKAEVEKLEDMNKRLSLIREDLIVRAEKAEAARDNLRVDVKRLAEENAALRAENKVLLKKLAAANRKLDQAERLLELIGRTGEVPGTLHATSDIAAKGDRT